MNKLKLQLSLLSVLVALTASWAAAQNYVAASAGRIEGTDDTMAVGSAITGTIAEIHVTEGDRVTKNSALARLSCEPLEREIDMLRAEAAVAKAVLARVENGARPEEVALAVALVREANANSMEADAVMKRQRSLEAGASISRARIMQAEHAADAARAILDAATARLELLEAGARREEVEEASARLAVANARTAEAEARLDLCTIRAPADGTVLSRHISVGQLVSVTTPIPMFRIADLEIRRVRAEVDERDLFKICMGQMAAVTAEGFPAFEGDARVTEIMPSMGRRTVLSGDPAEKSDKDVREVILELARDVIDLPIGLRVVVRFLQCDTHDAVAQGGASSRQ